MNDVPLPHLDEQRARSVLARAIEIDAQTSTTSIVELRSIAVELGVSPAALDAALREQLHPEPRPGGHPGAATAVAASGLALGAAAGIALSTVPLFNVAMINSGLTAVALVASGTILVLQGPAVTLRSFGARNLALWGGYAAGGIAAIAILGGSPVLELSWIYPISGAVRNFASTTILGTAAVLSVRKALPRSNHESKDDPSGGLVQRTFAAITRAGSVLRRVWKPAEMRALRHLRAPGYGAR